MGYETGEWVPDPKPPTVIINGSADEMFAHLEELLGDFWDVACPDFDLLTPFEAQNIIRDLATSMVIEFYHQCRHCGGWDGTVEFFNDEGTQVFSFAFSD
jgi:hypothetical protein